MAWTLLLFLFQRLHLFAADCRVPRLSCQEERTRNYEDNKQINSHPTPRPTILGHTMVYILQ